MGVPSVSSRDLSNFPAELFLYFSIMDFVVNYYSFLGLLVDATWLVLFVNDISFIEFKYFFSATVASCYEGKITVHSVSNQS